MRFFKSLQVEPVPQEASVWGRFLSPQKLCQEFSDHRRGAIAILFGFMLTIVVTLVGGAVDYARWMAAKAETVNAMDAAVLAGGRALQLGKTEAEAVQIAQNYYDKNKSNRLQVDLVTFAVEGNGTEVIAQSGESKVQTPLLSVAGVPDLKVNVKSRSVVSAGANSGSHVEISLMLDTTGSMGWSSSSGGSKMSHLKSAAKDLVEIVIWADQSEFTSRVALAPFAVYVKIPNANKQAITNANKRCVKERQGTNRYTDEAPSSSNGYFARKNNDSCGKEIRPLTSNKTDLKDWIDELPSSGGTAGHLGTAWSWYLLSPKWNGIWSSSSQPKPYSMLTQLNEDGQPLLRKIAVLMTDGEYNRKYSGDSSTTQARAICANMKAAGIEVYSVGFEISVGGEADATMKQCATSEDNHYYNAADGDELRTAFRDIALKISTLRISE